MGFVNRWDEEIKCRICKQIFCCLNCRYKHEKNDHDLKEPDCDICVYGVVPISILQKSQISDHFRTHLPLRCVRCEEIFESFEEIVRHDVGCKMDLSGPSKSADGTKTSSNLEIPEKAKDFTTSTPTNVHFNENNHYFNQVAANTPLMNNRKITPVGTTAIKDHSYDMKALQPFVRNHRRDFFSNKRVTFNDSLPELSVTNFPENILKSSLKKTMRRLNVKESVESVVESSNTIAIKTNNENVIGGVEVVATTTTTTKKRRSYTLNEFNESVYESANEVSLEEGADKEKMSVGSSNADAAGCLVPVPKKAGLWSTMTFYFKNVVENFTSNKLPASNTSDVSVAMKRQLPLCDSDFIEDQKYQRLKRLRLADIKGRPAIRSGAKNLIFKIDKSTQTDDYLLYDY